MGLGNEVQVLLISILAFFREVMGVPGEKRGRRGCRLRASERIIDNDDDDNDDVNTQPKDR